MSIEYASDTSGKQFEIKKEDLKSVKIISELMLGVSFLSKKNISSLFSEDVIDTYLCCIDCIAHDGYDNVVEDFLEGVEYSEEIDESYNYATSKSNALMKDMKSALAKTGSITYNQFMNMIKKYDGIL